MPTIKVIITGATGMVGEGVLFECLRNEKVSEILLVSRRHYELQDPKLKELIVPDFFHLDDFAENLKGYDASFFCAGVSSIGMKEDKYYDLTYNTTMAFAKSLVKVSNNLVFIYVSGAKTDSSEKGKMMWARIKGKTENHLMALPFKNEYNFRPGVMLPFPGQKNWNSIYEFIAKTLQTISPKKVLTLKEVGKAMINAVIVGYHKPVLEISDIRNLAKI